MSTDRPSRNFDPRDQEAYDALQGKLIPLWSSLDHLNTDEQTIVVVPSADVDIELTPSHLQAYEERFPFLLFFLRQPRARMIFVTGQRIADEIIDFLTTGTLRKPDYSRDFPAKLITTEMVQAMPPGWRSTGTAASE